MATTEYVVFDFGASNGRAMVATFDGSAFTMDTIHRFENGPVLINGHYHWDFLYLLSQLKIGLQLALKKYPNIVSLAVDTWGCDFGMVDSSGRLIANPLAYRDRSRHDIVDELYAELPQAELFRLSGGSTNPIMSIYQLYAFRKQNALELRQADLMLMIPDLLNYCLTGTMVSEYSNATMSLLCNQTERTWEPEILDRLALPTSILGDLVFPGSTIGRLQPEITDELQIPDIKVVACASHDTASAVVGIPVAGTSQDWAFISMGTWCISGIELAEPIINDGPFAAGYGNNATADGRTMLVKYTTGLWIIQQCREKWERDGLADVGWDQLDSHVRRSSFRNSVIDVDDDDLGIVQPDMPEIIRNLCRKSGQPVPQEPGDVARTVLQSLAVKFADNLAQLESFAGRKIQILHLVGGGTQNTLLCQWIADAMNVQVIAGPTETTSVGNLLMQLQASNELSSIEAGRMISRSSSTTTEYLPGKTSLWTDLRVSYLRSIESSGT